MLVPILWHYFGRLWKLLGVMPHRHHEPAFEAPGSLMPSLCFLVHYYVISLHPSLATDGVLHHASLLW